jgi:hypothetical protein
MNWESITATCAVLGVMGAIGLFMVKSIVQTSLDGFMSKIEERFATKDHVEVNQARISGLEARFNDSFRVHRGGRGD